MNQINMIHAQQDATNSGQKVSPSAAPNCLAVIFEHRWQLRKYYTIQAVSFDLWAEKAEKMPSRRFLYALQIERIVKWTYSGWAARYLPDELQATQWAPEIEFSDPISARRSWPFPREG